MSTLQEANLFGFTLGEKLPMKHCAGRTNAG